MNRSSLTIGQLAKYVGVTIRAVRHYHERGLLEEPPRDPSGYRRYDAQAVVDLIRIKTLVDAGVPLSRVSALLRAEPAEFADALTAIDQSLREKVRELQRHREHVAQLTHGDKLFLSDDVVELLEVLRTIGVSERTVQIERDGWILLSALSRERTAALVQEKRAALLDPTFQRLYLACDEALSWDSDDPRLAELTREMKQWSCDHSKISTPETRAGADVSVALELMNEHLMRKSPAWKRLSDSNDE